MCEIGGFMALRHNKLRDIAGALLEEVCHDIAIGPILQTVGDNNLVPSTSNTNDDVRLDASGSRVRNHFLTSGCLTPMLHDTNPEVL